MRYAAALVPLVALSACASGNLMREVQRPQAPATPSVILFSEQNEYRDAVVIDYITGVSAHSHILAEPNASLIRDVLGRALDNSGLAAGTDVRARYALAVEVLDSDGPNIGGGAEASLRVRYTLRERFSGVVVFTQDVDSSANVPFMGFNEHDAHRASQRSWTAVRRVAVLGLAPAALDMLYDPVIAIERRLDDTAPSESDLFSYDEWTREDWSDFWQVYKEALIVSALIGPVTVGAEVVNPWNFIPFADDEAAASARRFDPRGQRMGSERAAYANYKAVARNVSSFLVAFADAQNIEPIPILPCHGSPRIEAFKRELMSRGVMFRSDNCMIPR